MSLEQRSNAELPFHSWTHSWDAMHAADGDEEADVNEAAEEEDADDQEAAAATEEEEEPQPERRRLRSRRD